MNICIVGSGISGLSAAFYLAQEPDVNVEVFESSSVFGGRANVTAEGEHCPRLFLSDYHRLFEILRQIPIAGGDGSVYDGLREVKRFYFTQSAGWVELSHLYGFFARETSMRERVRIALARRRPPLVAEQAGPNTNRYGSRKNFSLRTIVKLGLNLLKSRSAYALDGPTDELLIHPWVRYLETRGVRFHLDTPVRALAPASEGVAVHSDQGSRSFDAVLVTPFVPDAIALLDASEIKHSLRPLNHVHCVCFTMTLHEDEPILDREEPGVYCRDGINLLVQAPARRCVVICTNSASTDAHWVMERVREMLGLEHDILTVKSRDNQLPNEAVYCADYVEREALVPGGVPGVHFAGSYVANSYPLDSAEGAVLSAWDAVRRIREEHELGLEVAAPELAEA